MDLTLRELHPPVGRQNRVTGSSCFTKGGEFLHETVTPRGLSKRVHPHTTHNARHFSMYGAVVLYEMQRKLVTVFRDTVQVFTLTYRTESPEF